MKPFLAQVVLAAALLPATALAEPTSGPVSITSLRPYSGSNVVYLYTNETFCPSGFYSIDLSSAAGKAVYAAALTALAAGKMVKLEIAGACGTGPAGSSLLQSIYIVQ